MMVGMLLAAGASARMGRAKALISSGTESYVAHGIRALWCACDTVVVVLGADAARIRERTEEEFVRLVEGGCFDQELRSARRHKAQKLEVRFAVNRAWRRGMYSSVRAGLAAANRLRPDAVLVLPVDHPSVRSTTVLDLARVMAQALQAARDRPRGVPRRGFSYALVPRFRGRRGHPVALSGTLARAIAADAAAADLSDAVRRNARLVGYLDVRDAGVTRNVNRPGD
ncbi:MAG TPA: NTP transferase domain-containing protein [Terriglobales bacterium]|nr:NTP transferase domain-containing protein [Terriglobales bacterium]